MNDNPPTEGQSPKWSSQLKIVIGMVFFLIMSAFIFYFRAIIGPLLMTFIITYLLYPLIRTFSRVTHFSWQWSANLIFVLLIAAFASLFTVTGVALVQQIQSLIITMENLSSQIPELIDQLSKQTLTFGMFQINLSQYINLNIIGENLLNTVQTLIGRAGQVVSPIASGAASFVGWFFFVLLLSYFVLVDAGQLPTAIENLSIPGYDRDIRKIFKELGRIWNSFLRGQVLIVSLIIVAYTVLLSVLGTRYAFGLAVMAGLARFVPYIGPLTTNTVTFFVAFLQTDNIYHADHLPFAITVVILMIIMDQIFDNFISPRIIGQTLGVHPAGVLISAIVATNLIGFVGLLLAAPVLATFQLIGQYISRKMFDLDPWPDTQATNEPITIPPIKRLWRKLIVFLNKRK